MPRVRSKWGGNPADINFNTLTLYDETEDVYSLLNSPELIEANRLYLIEMAPKRKSDKTSTVKKRK